MDLSALFPAFFQALEPGMLGMVLLGTILGIVVALCQDLRALWRCPSGTFHFQHEPSDGTGPSRVPFMPLQVTPAPSVQFC